MLEKFYCFILTKKALANIIDINFLKRVIGEILIN